MMAMSHRKRDHYKKYFLLLAYRLKFTPNFVFDISVDYES